MNDRLIQKIIAEKAPCYFISPHLDDAALSAGGLIAHLSRHTRVEIVTVFTAASPRPYTLSAQAFLSQCGYSDADVLFSDRRNEDAEACSLVGATQRHLGQVDALWRKVPSPSVLRTTLARILPEFLHAYPTYRMHVIRGTVSAHDEPLRAALGEELRSSIGKSGEHVIFCPLALQSHVDHALVRDACLTNFDNVILWRDFPYNIENGLAPEEIDTIGNEAFQWGAEKEMKEEMVRSYTSQVKAMFPDGNIPLVPEVYYAPK